MARQKDVLGKIVALKRQSAEQRVRLVQSEAEQAQMAITALASSLQALDEVRAGFDAHRLAEENGHARKLLADIRAGEAALAVKKAELRGAREALKRALHSEERLSNAGTR